MKAKILFVLTLGLAVSGCDDGEHYPLTHCDVGEQYPITCEPVSADDPVLSETAPELGL